MTSYAWRGIKHICIVLKTRQRPLYLNVLGCSDVSRASILHIRIKSGKFGHQVNSDTHLQTV